MTNRKILTGTACLIALMSVLSYFWSDKLGRFRFDNSTQDYFRILLDFIMLICLAVMTFALTKSKVVKWTWLFGFIYLIILSLDMHIWFRYFIPQNFIYIIHTLTLFFPVFILITEALSRYNVSIGTIIKSAIVWIVLTFMLKFILNDYQLTDPDNIDFKELSTKTELLNWSSFFVGLHLATIIQMLTRLKSNLTQVKK